MTSLHDLIELYDVPKRPLAVGDKVLFERGNDSGSFSINLGEVTEIKPKGEFKQPEVGVKGIHTFFPDGSNQPHKGKVPWGFTLSHFDKPVGERLNQHAERLEKRASEIRAWTETVATAGN